MTSKTIVEFTQGSPQGSDVLLGVDTLDTTESSSGTTKKFLQSDIFSFYMSAQGFSVIAACRLATTAALTATYNNGTLGVGATLTNSGVQAALTIDSKAVVVGDRILIKDQASTFQNGVYVVTTIGSASVNWVLTRATDYNAPADIAQYDIIFVSEGTVNNGTAFQETGAGPFTIGTTPITFAAFTAPVFTLPLPMLQGGTGSALTPAIGAILFSTASQINLLANPGVANKLFMSGANTDPFWSTATYPVSATVSGNLLISDGVNYIASTSLWPNTVGTSGKIVLSNGTSNVYSTPTYPNASVTSGKVIISDGVNYIASTSIFPNTVGAVGKIIRSDGAVNAYTTSTFADTYAVSTLLYASGANAVSGLATANRASLSTNATGIPVWLTLTDGQIVIGSTAGTPLAATLTAGTGVSITNASNSITISAVESGMAWSTVSGTTQAAAIDNGYVSGNAAQTTFTLPATAPVGSVVAVEGLGAAGWVLTANTGQTIKIGGGTTSSAGSLTSAAASDNVYVVCIVANTTWRVQTTNSAGLIIS